jgi:hypothetical protein
MVEVYVFMYANGTMGNNKIVLRRENKGERWRG